MWYTLPASLASSSLGTPLILVCLTAEHFLLSWDWALNFTQFMMLSTIPQDVAYGGQKIRGINENWMITLLRARMQRQWFFVGTCLMNLSLRGQVDPKVFCCSVMFSLVWESKVGFSIRQFTNSHMWFFTCRGSGAYSVMRFANREYVECFPLSYYSNYDNNLITDSQMSGYNNMTVPGKAWQLLRLYSSSLPLQWACQPPGQPHSRCASLPEVQRTSIRSHLQNRCHMS